MRRIVAVVAFLLLLEIWLWIMTASVDKHNIKLLFVFLREAVVAVAAVEHVAREVGITALSLSGSPVLVILEEEVNILIKRVVVHERPKLEEGLSIDWLRTERLNRIVCATTVAQMSRDVGRLADGDLNLAV